MINRIKQTIKTPTSTLISFRKKYLIPQYCFFLLSFIVSLYYFFNITAENYYIMVGAVAGAFILGLMIIFDSILVLSSEVYHLKLKNDDHL